MTVQQTRPLAGYLLPRNDGQLQSLGLALPMLLPNILQGMLQHNMVVQSLLFNCWTIVDNLANETALAMPILDRSFCFHLTMTAVVVCAGAACCLWLLFLLLVFFLLEGEAMRWLWGIALPWCLGPLPSRCLSTELFFTAIRKWHGEMHCWLLFLEILPAMSMASCVTHCSTGRQESRLQSTRQTGLCAAACLCGSQGRATQPGRSGRSGRSDSFWPLLPGRWRAPQSTSPQAPFSARAQCRPPLFRVC